MNFNWSYITDNLKEALGVAGLVLGIVILFGGKTIRLGAVLGTIGVVICVAVIIGLSATASDIGPKIVKDAFSTGGGSAPAPTP